jgi:hypothetical protein
MKLTELKLKPYAKLAALGALAVAAGASGFFLMLAWFTRSVPLGGIDGTQAILTVIALAIPFALLVAAHLVYARVLLRYASED